eukprot:UN28651
MHCLCYTSFLQNNNKDAWKFASQQSKLCNKILSKFPDSWYLPLFYSCVELMKIVAVEHDKTKTGGNAVKTLITDFLSIHRTIKVNSGSQKQAALFVINQILQLSFSTDQLGYCKTSILAMKDYLTKMMIFPKSHVV